LEISSELDVLVSAEVFKSVIEDLKLYKIVLLLEKKIKNNQKKKGIGISIVY
jgi:hypothetical protein